MLTVRPTAKQGYGPPEELVNKSYQVGWGLLGVALVALAFGLRVYELETKSIWLDEALSFHRAASFDQAISGLIVTGGVPSRDTQPPLYFVLLYGFLRLAGDSDFAAKFLSAFFSVLTVPVLAATGRRLGGSRVGLLAALLAASSPLYVWYAQEVRMYTLLVFFSALAFYLGLRSADGLLRGAYRSGMAWAGAAFLAASLGVLTQYLAFFVVPALGFGLVAALARRRRTLILGGSAFLALAAPPLLVEVLWGRLITGPTPQFREVSPLVILWDLLGRAAAGLVLEGPLLDGLAAVLLGLMLGGLLKGPETPGRWWLAGLVLLPAAAVALVGAQRPVISNVRHLIFATPGLYLAVALGLEALRRRFPATALVLLGILAVGAALGLIRYFDPALQKDDFRSLVVYLQQNVGPEDLVLVHEATVLHVFEHYDRGFLRVEALPPFGEAVGSRLSADFVARLERLKTTHRRVWFVYWPRSIAGDPAGLIPAWLDSNLFAVSDRTFAGRGMGVAVRAYVARPPTERTVPAKAHMADLRSADGLKIMGWEVASAPTADGRVELSFYFRAEGKSLPDYRLIVRLVDAQDHLWAYFDGRPIPTWPTDRWPLGEVVRADLPLRLAPGTPAGTYRLEVGLAPGTNGGPVPLLDAVKNPAGTLVGLGEVTLPGAHRHRPDFDRIVPDSLRIGCQCGLKLRELSPASRKILAGRLLTVRGYYQLTGPIESAAYRLALELRRGNEAVAAGVWPLGPISPAGPRPTVGDWLAGAYDLRVPVTVGSGEYRLVGRLLGPEGRPETLAESFGRVLTEVDLGPVQVVIPEQRFDPPHPAQPADVYFGNLLHLLGYTLETGGEDRLRVTLYWRVLGSSEGKLKVSVQLFSGLKLVAQDDAVPVGWTRPASTWVPGEYLTDPHEVGLPSGVKPGELTMRVILYDETSGRRVNAVQAGQIKDAAEFPIEVR